MIGADGHFGDFPEPPAAGRVSPPVERFHHHRVDPDRRHVKEARVARRREQQQPAGQPAQPGELADHDAGVVGDRVVGGRLLDQLRVPERHRDRRAELVRGVQQEHPLPLHQAQVLLGHPLHLVERRQPLVERRQPPPPVPDHHQEHQRDQRHLDQVVRVLLAPDDLDADDAAGRDRDHRERQDGRLQLPQPEPVDHREAHPDGEERDGPPLRVQPHRQQVQQDERRPDDVPPRRPRPAQLTTCSGRQVLAPSRHFHPPVRGTASHRAIIRLIHGMSRPRPAPATSGYNGDSLHTFVRVPVSSTSRAAAAR